MIAWKTPGFMNSPYLILSLYLWFNGKDFTNPNTMQNKTLSFNLYATGKNATLNG